MKDDSGPAFPLNHYVSDIGPEGAGFHAKDALGNEVWVNSGAAGISRRDYFRAHAPPLPATAWRSMITQATRRYGRHGSEFDTWERDRLVLTWMARRERQWRDAYADAMLKETHDGKE